MKKNVLIFLFIISLYATYASAIVCSPSSIVIAKDESQTIQVSGVTSGEFSIGGYDTNVVEASLEKNTITVHGKNKGETIVFVVDNDGTMAGCRVAVRENGSDLPTNLAVDVSGVPADTELLIEAARNAVIQKLDLKPGASLEITNSTAGLQSIKPGQSTMLKSLVKVSESGDSYSSERSVAVIFSNIGLDYRDDDYLLMSNNPEVLSQAGTLFREKITRGESVRLIYHHMNEKDGPPRLVKVVLQNPGNAALRVFMHQSFGGPTVDSLFAGHIATKRFLKQMMNKSGYIVTIPPKKSVTIMTHRPLKSEESVTGLVKLWVLDGDQCVVEVLAVDTLGSPQKLSNAAPSKVLSLDGFAGHVRGQFQPTKISYELMMDASDPDSVIDLGVKPLILSNDRQFKLIGNYGVVHEYKLRLTNASNTARSITLHCQPMGGLARAMFILNNKLIETGILDPHTNNKNKVTTFKLPAGSEQFLTLSTMPQAGSFYPVKLIFKGG